MFHGQIPYANKSASVWRNFATCAFGPNRFLRCLNVDHEGLNTSALVSHHFEHLQVRFLHLDLEDFSSVRKFAEEFDKSEEHLDYLVNNAGLWHKSLLFNKYIVPPSALCRWSGSRGISELSNYYFRPWGRVELREIDFLSKNLLIDSTSSPLWRLVTWI